MNNVWFLISAFWMSHYFPKSKYRTTFLTKTKVAETFLTLLAPRKHSRQVFWTSRTQDFDKTPDTNNLFSVVRRCMRVGFCQGAREFCQGHGGTLFESAPLFRFRFLCTTTSGGGAGFGGSGGTAPSSSRPAICPLNTKHNGILNFGPGGFSS